VRVWVGEALAASQGQTTTAAEAHVLTKASCQEAQSIPDMQ